MRSIFLEIIREIIQKYPKKLKNALKKSKYVLKSIKSAKNSINAKDTPKHCSD